MTTPDDVTRSREAAVDRRLRERDELAELIREKVTSGAGHYGMYWTTDSDDDDLPAVVADAVLAAGWRRVEPDREHLWAQWNAELLRDGYSSWSGDANCPD